MGTLGHGVASVGLFGVVVSQYKMRLLCLFFSKSHMENILVVIFFFHIVFCVSIHFHVNILEYSVSKLSRAK